MVNPSGARAARHNPLLLPKQFFLFLSFHPGAGVRRILRKLGGPKGGSGALGKTLSDVPGGPCHERVFRPQSFDSRRLFAAEVALGAPA